MAGKVSGLEQRYEKIIAPQKHLINIIIITLILLLFCGLIAIISEIRAKNKKQSGKTANSKTKDTVATEPVQEQKQDTALKNAKTEEQTVENAESLTAQIDNTEAELQKAKSLFEKGLITEEEFKAKKAAILGI